MNACIFDASKGVLFTALDSVMLACNHALEPTTLACMHGAAYRGNGARILRALASALEA
jgi:hypothetical protein